MLSISNKSTHLIGTLLTLTSIMLFTTCGDDDEVLVPSTDRLTVTLTSPSEGSVFFLGDSIFLQGTATDETEAAIADSDLSWKSDMDGFIGNGSVYWKNSLSDTTESGKKAKQLSVNDHLITFTAIHPSGISIGVDAVNISIDIEEIKAIEIYGGNLVIGGKMDRVSGTGVTNIASWNGSVWSGLGGGVFRFLEVMAVSGTDLYVAGNLTQADGQSVNNIAVWNGGSWSALGDGVSSSDETILLTVTSISAEGSDVYVGGNINAAGGVSLSGIAWWNGTSWSNMGGGLTPLEKQVVSVMGIKANSVGQVFVGGSFALAGTTKVENIAMWDGADWKKLSTGVFGGDNPSIIAMALSDNGDLYVGGNFKNAGFDTTYVLDSVGVIIDSLTTIAPLEVNHIARWNGTTWSNLGEGLSGGSNPSATTIVIDNMGILYVIGNFSTAGGIGNVEIGVYDPSADSWSALDLTGGPTDVTQIAANGADLYAIDNVISLWRWNGAQWDSLGTAGE